MLIIFSYGERVSKKCTLIFVPFFLGKGSLPATCGYLAIILGNQWPNVLPCLIVLLRNCHRLVTGHNEVKLGCWKIDWKFSKFDRWILMNFFNETGWFLISMVHNWGEYITKTIKSTIWRYVTWWISPTCRNGQKSKIPNSSNKGPILFLLSFGTTIVVIL